MEIHDLIRKNFLNNNIWSIINQKYINTTILFVLNFLPTCIIDINALILNNLNSLIHCTQILTISHQRIAHKSKIPHNDNVILVFKMIDKWQNWCRHADTHIYGSCRLGLFWILSHFRLRQMCSRIDFYGINDIENAGKYIIEYK